MRAPAGIRRFHVTDAVLSGLNAVPAVWAGAWAVMVALCAATAFAALVSGVVPQITFGIVALMAWGAAARVAIFGADAGAHGLAPGGVQVGRAERHMPAAALLNLLFLAMIGAVLTLVLLAVAGASDLNVEAIRARDWQAAGAGWKVAVVAGAGLVATAVVVLLLVRLSLFSLATVGRDQPVSLNTLGIATGSFWRLLTLLLVVAAPLIAALAVRGDAGLAARIAAAALWTPFAAGALGRAYGDLEYWKPGEG